MNDTHASSHMSAAIRWTSLALTVMLLVMALVTGYWQVARGEQLVQREDNPRRVLAEQQIPRGAILDRTGHILALSRETPAGYRRDYPEPAAAPVVGYYSLRYGVGGIEASFDRDLRGVSALGTTALGTTTLTRLDESINRLLHRTPPGRDVRLTVDLAVQRAASAGLGNQAGAVVVLSIPDGEVIALSSHPTFDPASLDDDWERLRADVSSPLLNRATQGTYQPGAAFQTILLAAALSKGVVNLTDTVQLPETGPHFIELPVEVNGKAVPCAATPSSDTWAAAYAAGCPAPFGMLPWHHYPLVLPEIIDAIHGWKLDVPSASFELPTRTTDFDSGSVHGTEALSTTALSTTAVYQLAIGQGALIVSPMQMALVAATLANDGKLVSPPHLVAATSDPTTSLPSAVSPDVARSLKAALPVVDTLAGQTALAVSGQGYLTWFVGFAPAQAPRWAIVVLLERADVASCRQIAASVSRSLRP